MVTFRNFVIGLYASLFFLIVLLVGDYLRPGKLGAGAFTDIGLLIIFFAITLDVVWALSPDDVRKETPKRGVIP